MADTSLGISLVIKAVDQGTAVLSHISAALDKIGLSSQSAGAKADQAGKQMTTAFSGVSDHLERTSQSMKKVEDTLTSVGTALAGIGAAITAPLALAVKTAANFENEMNKVKAVADFSPDTKVAQEQFDALTAKAREFGSSTAYSAAEVAQGMGELARAGYDTEKIIGAIGPALNLAFSEGRGMKETVEDLVGILSSFGLSVDQANRVTDVLAKTSNATTTSMSELAEALKYAAPIAAQLGMNVEETSAYLGIFANNNIKASMAGTGLRRIIGTLSDPTNDQKAALAALNVEVARTANGSVDLTQTFERLAKSGLTTADAFKIFGDLGATVALIATKNVEKIKELNNANENAGGSLQKVVDTINSGLLPAWKRFTSAIGDVAIQFAGPFLSGLKSGLDGIASMLRWVVDLGKQFPILSSIITGGAAAFGLITLALGSIALAAAGFFFALRKIREGYDLVIGGGTRFLQILREKTGAISKETALLNENTAALQRNAQARQAGQQKGAGGVTSGRAGGSLPVPSKGAGVGLAGAALGIGAGLLEGQLNLTPTENAVAKVGELGGMLAAFGPVAGTIIAGISSWVKLLTVDVWDLLDVWGLWTSKPKAPDAFTARIDATLKQMDAEISQGRTFVNNVETAIGRAVSDFGGSINEYAAEWKRQFGEELPLAIREGFKRAQDQLKGGMGFDDMFVEATAGLLKLEDKLGATKSLLDTLTKATETFYGTLRQVDEIRLGNLRNEIVAAHASEKLAVTELASLETAAAAQRIVRNQREFAEKKALREQEHAAVLAMIAEETRANQTDTIKLAELTKKRADTEKAFRDASLQEEKTLQEGIATEIKKQQDVIKSTLEQRRTLENDIRNEVVESQRAQRDVAQKSMTEMGRLRDNYGQAVENLRAANALLPTMPEKAMELAKKARDEFKGLATDINALRKDLDSTFKENQEMLRDLNKKNMSPAAAWVSDLDHVKALIAEAEKLMKQGEFEKAAELAGKARQPAAGLAKAPEGSGFTDAQTAEVARTYLTAAIELQEAAKKGGIAYAQEVNKGVGEGIGKAGIVVKTAQEALLDQNTEQLRLHGELLQALSNQYNTIIAQNNKLIEVQGGKGVEAPLSGIAGQLAEAGGLSSTLSGQLTPEQQKAVGIVGAGIQAGGTVGATDIASLSPDVQSLIADVNATLQASRATSLQASAEESEMANRMKALKYLETKAGQLDRSERAGYGVSAAADSQLQSDIEAVLGRKVTGADVNSAQRNIDTILSGITGGLGSLVERAKGGGVADTTPNVTEAQAKGAEQIQGAATLFQEAVAAVAKVFGQPINISINLEGGDGTITRY